MCELIFDMSSYMQSTKCLEDCDVFYIFKRSYERLIAKRNSFCINKMKENVYMKLVARNNRLKCSHPIDLYRSMQYTIELANKKRNLLIETNNKQTNLNNNVTKGPLVKLDLRPKSTAYNLLIKKQSKIQANNQNQNDTKNNSSSSIEFDSKEHENDFSNETNDSSDNLNDGALQDLELRMKKWHMDLGCRKAFVPKLNRIDIDVTIFLAFVFIFKYLQIPKMV